MTSKRDKEPTEEQPKQPRATVGRVVHYRMSQADVEEIEPLFEGGKCNAHEVGQQVPAIVSLANDAGGGAVNLRVLLDGMPTLWRKDVPQDDVPGSWAWPARA